MSNSRTKISIPQQLQLKNEADFEIITNRIRDGLKKITSNRKLKPTQAVLAKLAMVSRGTLNNRGWPLQELEKIKSQRKEVAQVIEDEKVKSAASKAELSLEERLVLSRETIAKYLSKLQASENEISRLNALNEAQEKRIQLLCSQLEKLSNDYPTKNVVGLKKIMIDVDHI